MLAMCYIEDYDKELFRSLLKKLCAFDPQYIRK